MLLRKMDLGEIMQNVSYMPKQLCTLGFSLFEPGQYVRIARKTNLPRAHVQALRMLETSRDNLGTRPDGDTAQVDESKRLGACLPIWAHSLLGRSLVFRCA